MDSLNIKFFMVIFIITTAMMVFFSYFISKNKSSNNDSSEYFLASRKLGLLATTFTLVATQLGSGMILGTSQSAYDDGGISLLYCLGMSIGFLILGFGIAAKLRSLNISTTAEVFTKYYGSPFLRKIASVLSILTLGGILTATINASYQILEPLTGDNTNLIMTIAWGTIILWTSFGGLKAVVATDIFQVILILVVMTLVMGVFFRSDITVHLSDFLKSKNGVSHSMPWSSWQGIFLMPILYSFIEQDLAQRFFSCRSKKIASLSSIISGVIILSFSLVPCILGVAARNIDSSSISQPALAVIDHMNNSIITAFFLCAVLAAIGSTADSLLCAISSNIVLDFSGNKFSERKAQIGTIIIGCLGVLFSFLFKDILKMITISYGMSVSTLFVPTIVCLYKKRLNKASALVSILVSLVCYLIILGKYKINDSNKYMIYPLILSFLSYYTVDLILNKRHSLTNKDL